LNFADHHLGAALTATPGHTDAEGPHVNAVILVIAIVIAVVLPPVIAAVLPHVIAAVHPHVIVAVHLPMIVTVHLPMIVTVHPPVVVTTVKNLTAEVEAVNLEMRITMSHLYVETTRAVHEEAIHQALEKMIVITAEVLPTEVLMWCKMPILKRNNLITVDPM
jgi:hypothetical protein